MALEGQQTTKTDNAPYPNLDPKRKEQIDMARKIADQFVFQSGGHEMWWKWLEDYPNEALDMWEKHLKNPRSGAFRLTPKGLRMAYARLGFSPDIINQRVPLSSKSTIAATTATAETTMAAPTRKQRGTTMGGQNQQQQQRKQQQQKEQQEARTWLANVFQKFYGAGIGEPNGYQYSIAQDPQSGLRQVRIFQDPNDAARSFVFVEQPNGAWELRSGAGQPIIGNVHYDSQQRRFFALGVSENDILNAFQKSSAGQQQQGTNANGTQSQGANAGQNRSLPAGVTTSFQLGDGSIFTVSVDGKARVLRPLGENQWAVVMERPLQELLNVHQSPITPMQQPQAGSAQPAGEPQSSEQMPSWMTLLMMLFLLMGRR